MNWHTFCTIMWSFINEQHCHPGHWILIVTIPRVNTVQLPQERTSQSPSCRHHVAINLHYKWYRILLCSYFYTPVWRAAMWIKCLECWWPKVPGTEWWDSNPHPFDPQSREQSNVPRHLHIYTFNRQIKQKYMYAYYFTFCLYKD